MDWQKLLDDARKLGLEWSIKVLGAAAILVGGWIAARIGRALLRKMLTKAKIDATLVGFISNLAYFLLMAVIFIAALGTAGVATGSLVAVVGAAGLAVGFALQGSLSNFAAGIMIIFFRPFKVGDVVEIAGVIGLVDEIQVFATQLRTGDNKRIVIPNATLTSGTLVNYSAHASRRIDLVFGIGYRDDIDKAKGIVQAILAAHPKIHKAPAPVVAVGQLAESSVNLVVRPWTSTEDYWDVLFDLHESVKKAFDKQGITIPYPQRQVHVRLVA
jgi:small conductance mechanosensitive channel